MIVNIKINGMLRELNISPEEFLVDTLRRYGYKGVKKGCDTANCGACSVLMDGKPVLSCAVFAAKADGHEILTIEGVQPEAKKIAEYITAEGADQCGFCGPGLVITVIGLKNENKNPTEEEIKSYLLGNMCRCSGYEGQHRGIVKYFKELNG